MDKVENRRQFSDYLGQKFAESIEKQRTDLAKGDFSKYITVFKKKDNIFRKIEKKLKR